MHYRQGAATPDGMGGETYAAPTMTTVWCKARQLSMGQKFNYGLESGTVTYDFRFKYLTAQSFTFDDWFIYEGAKYIINSINNITVSARKAGSLQLLKLYKMQEWAVL